jgi:hypothetical protein
LFDFGYCLKAEYFDFFHSQSFATIFHPQPIGSQVP